MKQKILLLVVFLAAVFITALWNGRDDDGSDPAAEATASEPAARATSPAGSAASAAATAQDRSGQDGDGNEDGDEDRVSDEDRVGDGDGDKDGVGDEDRDGDERDAAGLITGAAAKAPTMAELDPDSIDYDPITEARQMFHSFEAAAVAARPLDLDRFRGLMREHKGESLDVLRRAGALNKAGYPNDARELMDEWNRLWELYKTEARTGSGR